MNPLRIIFFGSTTDSVLVLSRLFQVSSIPSASRAAGKYPFGLAQGGQVSIAAVVTQPPRPVGREKMIRPTPVETWAKAHDIPVLSFPSDARKSWLYADEEVVIDSLEPLKADLLVSASYGQKIPTKTIADARYGGLNIHPSLLPRWRGADPVPWAILTGDHQTGVTVVTLAEKFDEGRIIAQKKISITDKDTSDPLRTKLFKLGAQLLIDILASKGLAFKGSPQQTTDSPYARRFTRDDGFEPWEAIEKAFTDREEARRIERKFRALTPWPGVWTNIGIMNQESGSMENKRLKILKLHLYNSGLILDEVQLEGKTPVSWQQFSSAYQVPK